MRRGHCRAIIDRSFNRLSNPVTLLVALSGRSGQRFWLGGSPANSLALSNFCISLLRLCFVKRWALAAIGAPPPILPLDAAPRFALLHLLLSVRYPAQR